MSKNKIKGQIGEQLALSYLSEKGYAILAQNHRVGRAEIDLIARDEQEQLLVFVEVKYRTSDAFGWPEQCVHPDQQARIAEAAVAYSETIGWEGDWRFDLIAILHQKGRSPDIEHFEDVF
ncbi:MAG: YraN family protein [Bernardetiaceae bacterium]